MFLRKHLDELFGLSRPVSALTQEHWDRFVPHRLNQGIALETNRDEFSYFRSLIQQVGPAPEELVVPEFDVFVRKDKKA